MERERLGSRLGFILLSAGCAIGVGNVWKFPSLCGANGGGIFVLFYVLFLVILGLPVMIMEFSLGRASQSSPVGIYQKLQKPGQKWHYHGYFALGGNVILMMFYTSVTGWILYYFIKFLTGDLTRVGNAAALLDGNKLENVTKASEEFFGGMMSDPAITVGMVAIVVILGFVILSFGLQNGVERITKYMMIVLLVLMVVLAGYSFTLDGVKEALTFYLKPDFSKISGNTIVAAMNQAFFTLSLGIGSMAIFGSYLGKDRSLMGESINILVLDTFVAVTAGLIIFPACFTYGVSTEAGPSLLFESMTTVFNNMAGGRWWGTLFFLFMFFAAMSTIIAVSQNILACVRELTNWKRVKACIICGIAILILSIPCALGSNLLSDFVPFNSNSSVLDLEDFIVSYCLLPLGALCYVLFCVSKKGWGFQNFLAEANAGKGLKVQNWMRGYMTYVVPLIIIALFLVGIFTFPFADNFTIWGWLKSTIINTWNAIF